MIRLNHLIENQLLSDSFTKLVIAFGFLFIFAILLIVGRRLDSALKLERLGIPISILFGAFALLIGPHGPSPLLPESITDIWVKLPTALLTMVFATLMLSKPVPSGKGLFQPVASQALLALLLGFGQYLIGGLVLLLFLIPYQGVDPLMGCLIEVGFEGGHGAAAVMGQSFERLGFSEGLDLGLAMATVGLLASTLLGSGLVVVGRLLGWISFELETLDREISIDQQLSLLQKLKNLVVNLGLVGLAVAFGATLLVFVRFFGGKLGGTFNEVLSVFPVFPLALLGSLVIRFVLEKFEKTELVSEILQREIGILSTDLLITTAMAGLDLPLLLNDWIPLSALALSGLLWNLFGMFLFSRLLFRQQWFERSIIEFGNATGVAASGILLLRLADPRDQTNILPIFSIKQLFLQPLLSGGLITVIAPISIIKLGLIGWTEICGALTLLFLIVSILMRSQEFSQSYESPLS